MPPFGLWTVPRHHVYGGQMKRSSFNSNEFAVADETVTPVDTSNDTTATLDDASDPQIVDEREKKKKEKERKKKHKHSISHSEDTKANGAEATAATPHTVKSEVKRKKKDKQKIADTPEQHPRRKTKDEEHAANIDQDEPRSSKKKRKRNSEIATAPITPHIAPAVVNFPIGQHWADDVWAAINGRDPLDSQSIEVQHESEKPKKKKKKSRTSSEPQPEEPNEPTPGPRVAVDGDTPRSSKKSKKKHRKSGDVTNDDNEVHAPTPPEAPVPKLVAPTLASSNKTPNPNASPRKPRAADVSPKTEVTKAGPRKTPIPLPQSFPLPASPEPASNAEILVPETPPSKTYRVPSNFSSTSVPFKLTQKTPVASTGLRLTKLERPAPSSSTPIASRNSSTPKSAPPMTARSKTPIPLPTVPNALTDANLTKHTQPLNAKSKPKRRSKSAPSNSESAGSNSIKEMFARAGKRKEDPIVDTNMDMPQHKKQEEPSTRVFDQKFRDLQDTVIFSEELKHLEDYLIWIVENDAVPPCLGNATGCTAKREELLRLGKEENMNIHKFMDFEGADLNVVIEATNRARHAEELLMLSLKAEIPVPIGQVGGTWTLYCPKYAETHFDRFGHGQRTLTINPIAGFKHRNSYTARLNIPPRTMAYTILTFATPPHASFRTTTIKTAAEGYAMDVLFLGNGYLQLRVDLKLLLKGKATEEVEGKKMLMEFIGVHEQAVQWWEKKGSA
ncbi:hypothetical protein CC80DRAFT_133091 [Byssothecium circinans]|uniref:Uncharacterized protein n=1 Tax=Byssothecium circinans TaxID=147558 RepID=A0A6A5TM09_9PLEO|nr:hypothetical protein CC80DRAFT_133091 [Byssothecium circinans]